MDDQKITRILRDLPREEASPYFTAGVLRRIKSEARPAPWRRLALAASAAAVLLVSLVGVRGVLEGRREMARTVVERQAALERLELLETRKQALEEEIRSLRRMAQEAQGVVYLGSTPNLDVVVDLNRLARRSHAPARFVKSPIQGENYR